MGNNRQQVPQRTCIPRVATPGLPKSSFSALGNIPHAAVFLARLTPSSAVPSPPRLEPTPGAPMCPGLQSGSTWTCGAAVVQFSLERLIWWRLWQGTPAWGTRRGPAALHPAAAALIPLPRGGKWGTGSRREGADGACDGTQRKADHSELFDLETTELILYSSTRERILYLGYTIC